MGMLDYLGRAPSRKRLLSGDVPNWIKNSPRARYIAAVVLSAPPWVDRKALRALKQQCVWISEMTGVEHCIDRIIPLNHPRVCGLTVPWDLRIIPRKPNESKGNRWCPDQLELFNEHEEGSRTKRKATVRRDGRRPQAEARPVLGLHEGDERRMRQAHLWEPQAGNCAAARWGDRLPEQRPTNSDESR